MKQIEIEFGKLELGTRFFDPHTKDYYRKVSEYAAEPESDKYNNRVAMNTDPNDSFCESEIVIVE